MSTMPTSGDPFAQMPQPTFGRSGIFGFKRPTFSIPQEVNDAAAAAPKKGGFFGPDGFGRYLAGAIGDALAVNGGMRPGFADAMARRQEQELLQTRRASEWTDWIAKQQYERDNPATPQPTEFERLLSRSGFSPEEQTKTLQDYVRNRANPMIPFQGMDESGNRTVTFLPRSGQSQASQPHPEAVKALLAGEGTDAQFDEVYGAGAAARVRGAGSGQPNFR